MTKAERSAITALSQQLRAMQKAEGRDDLGSLAEQLEALVRGPKILRRKDTRHAD